MSNRDNRLTQHHDFLLAVKENKKKLCVRVVRRCEQHRKSCYALGNVVTGSAGSICALGLLLGRVPFFNDGVTSWHVFNWSAGGKNRQRHVNWTRQTDFSILTTAHLFCRKVCGVIDLK